jgi:predicted nucleic acid-binding protein
VIIFDASTLILLAKIDILETFALTFPEELVIPLGVKEEACRKEGEETPLIENLLRRNTIRVLKVKDTKIVKRLMDDFHINGGEAEAVSLALQEKALIVATDDRNAIRACKMLKIDFTTAIAILIRTFEKKLIDRDEAIIKLQKLEVIARYSRAIMEDARERIEGGA